MERAVGFDLDDTLAVTDRDRATLLATALERAGGPALAGAITREDYVRAHRRNLASETREPVFADLLANHGGGAGEDGGVDPAAVAAAYRESVTAALRPAPGARDLVEDLRARGYRVGLLTDGPRRAQRTKLRELGWTDLFDAVVISGEIGVGKPDGEAFRALVEALDAPGGTVYVGDDPEADVGGAVAAGLPVVQVVDGGEPDPRADAAVDRAALAERLPGILADLESD